MLLAPQTLSDALIDRNAVGESPRRIFDCDTGSLIFLAIAENLSDGRNAFADEQKGA